MWECRKCHERHEDSFEICWNCGTAMDGTEDLAFRRVEDDGSAAVLADLADAPVSQAPPVRSWHCPKCHSVDIMHGVRVVDHGHLNSPLDLQVEVKENPDAIVWSGTHRGTLTASVCGACGYTELYVASASELLAAYRNRHAAQTQPPPVGR